jgi:CubicO group peptidase (beta-lactamase class C family)
VALDRDIRAGTHGHIDRLLVVAGGRLVVDHRYARDYREISRGRVGPLGCGEGCADPAWMHDFNYYHPRFHPFHDGREVHSLQSVTKSIAATAIGVAIGRGEISGVDRPFLEFFDDRDLSKIDARTRAASLADLLTMRTGIEWHEQDRPLDETNTTLMLERSDDWIQFTLSQPADAAPGTKWAYNSGGSHLMSGIIRRATGRFIDDYAGEFLFRPLGITDWYWKRTPKGYPDTEGGLYLRAEDLARIGYLYLRDGVWNGRRILPDGWVRQATTRHVTGVAPGWDYGFQWWLTRRNGVDVWAGRGFGGQLLFVVPDRDLVGVVNAWNIFGDRTGNLSGAFLDALTGSSDRVIQTWR